MATKEIKLAVYKVIKDNLKRRLKTLEEQKSDPFGFSSAQTAYFKYLNENIIVSRTIKELIFEERIPKPEMVKIFNTSVLIPGFRNKKVEKYQLSTPPFWDEELENRFGLRKEFIRMMRPPEKEEVAPKNSIFSDDLDDLINGERARKMMPIIRHLHDDILEKLDEETILIESSHKNEDENKKKNNYPKTIYLVTKSIILDSVIFFVIDEHFNIPERFSIVNKKGGPTCITKLHNIAYPAASAPNKKVEYSKQLADGINNGLFKRKKIKEYIKTNKLNKPTLVKKSSDGKILVLNNDTQIEDITIQKVPSQFRYLYIDKIS